MQDAAAGALKLEYDFMKSLPNLGGTPIPFLPHRYVKRNAGKPQASFRSGSSEKLLFSTGKDVP